jgi:uncharacterized lipoprotein NlpE involved in copper resistance
MKKYFLLMITMLAITLSALAINVPKAVSDAFTKKFPGATNVKWDKENKNEYEAEFTLNGKSGSANFLTDGSWVETEMEINVSDLPAAASTSVKTKYPGATIIKVYKLDNAKGELTYEAELKTGNKKKEMVLKADGTIVK